MSQQRIKLHDTVTVLVDNDVPTKVFFSGDALTESNVEGVNNVSDDVASDALSEIERRFGGRYSFTRWVDHSDHVEGTLSAH